MLAYVTGSVDEELLLHNEYLVTENRLLRNQIKGRLRLTDPERISLADIGKRLGRKALAEVTQMVRPETILGWHRKLIARKFDGSKHRSTANHGSPGKTIEDLMLRVCPGESHLGVPPHRRRTEQPGTRGQSPDGGQRSQTARSCARAGTGKEDVLARVHPIPHRSPGGSRFLHDRGVDPRRLDHLLRSDVHARGLPESTHCRDNDLAGFWVDAANGAECD